MDIYPFSDTRIPCAALRFAFPEISCWRETASRTDGGLEYRAGPWTVYMHAGNKGWHVVYSPAGACGNGNSTNSLEDAKKMAFFNWEVETKKDYRVLADEEVYFAAKARRCHDDMAKIDAARTQHEEDKKALYPDSAAGERT